MRKNFALFISACFFSLFVAELALRAIGVEEFKPKPNAEVNAWISVPEQAWMEYHPTLGWFHQKNKTAMLTKGKNLSLEIHTNDQGFRGTRNYTAEPTDSMIRIVVLGDSFAFGFGVRDEETFAARMETLHEHVEVLNLGVPGYGIDQMLLSFSEIGKSFHPHIVVIAIYPEDFWRATRSFTDAGYAKPYFSLSRSGGLVLHNVPVPKPYQMQSNQFPEVFEKEGTVETTLLKSALYRVVKKAILRFGRDMGWIDPDLSDEWLLGRQILKSLIDEIRLANARPVIAIIPPHEWLSNTKPTSFQKSLRHFSEKLNVPLVDLTPAFSAAAQKSKVTDLYIDGDWHWTAKGHEIAASTLRDFFIQSGFLNEDNRVRNF